MSKFRPRRRGQVASSSCIYLLETDKKKKKKKTVLPPASRIKLKAGPMALIRAFCTSISLATYSDPWIEIAAAQTARNQPINIRSMAERTARQLTHWRLDEHNLETVDSSSVLLIENRIKHGHSCSPFRFLRAVGRFWQLPPRQLH